jgi:hypothetical protein
MRYLTTGVLVGAITVVGCTAPGAKPPEENGYAGAGACTLQCADAAFPPLDVDAAMAGSGGADGNAGESDAGDAAVASNDASTPDAMNEVDAGMTSCGDGYAQGPSRCTVTETSASCEHNEHTIGGRLVYSQVPMGDAPEAGWPTVVVYQGSIYGPTVTWTGDASMPFGGLNQVKLQAMLLDHGFMVIAPAAEGIAWNTNFPGYDISSDSRFIPLLIEEIGSGTFGPANTDRLYATGISSGGYMTSRMAVSYAGTFRALAIESGSYATCSNNACLIPNPLPSDHPPTLFLHGRNDLAVPIGTAEAYKAQLDMQGVETAMVVDETVGHQWLKVAPQEITCWFLTH